jgi:hypothetical protein
MHYYNLDHLCKALSAEIKELKQDDEGLTRQMS